MSVQGPEDLLKFGRLRQEKKYEVALNRAYVLRAIRPSVQTRVREEGIVLLGPLQNKLGITPSKFAGSHALFLRHLSGTAPYRAARQV